MIGLDTEQIARKERELQLSIDYNKKLQQMVASMKENERSLTEQLEKLNRDSISSKYINFIFISCIFI